MFLSHSSAIFLLIMVPENIPKCIARKKFNARPISSIRIIFFLLLFIYTRFIEEVWKNLAFVFPLNGLFFTVDVAKVPLKCIPL